MLGIGEQSLFMTEALRNTGKLKNGKFGVFSRTAMHPQTHRGQHSRHKQASRQ